MDLTGFKYIVVDEDVLGGKPRIKNTKVSVDVILESLANGWSIEEVAEGYKISVDAILEAVKFASQDTSKYKL